MIWSVYFASISYQSVSFPCLSFVSSLSSTVTQIGIVFDFAVVGVVRNLLAWGVDHVWLRCEEGIISSLRSDFAFHLYSYTFSRNDDLYFHSFAFVFLFR